MGAAGDEVNLIGTQQFDHRVVRSMFVLDAGEQREVVVGPEMEVKRPRPGPRPS
jgi:hypothetical protein